MGEGEYAIVELANKLTGESSVALKHVSMRVDGVVKMGEKCVINEIDALPLPVRDTLVGLIKKNGIRESRLVTSRGCIGNCSFCTSPSFYNRTWRGHSPDRVVYEIRTLIRDYGISHVWINDDAYIIKTRESQHRAYNIAKGIIDKKLSVTYRALLRADSLDNALDMLPILKASGLNTVFVGFEAASDYGLEVYTKGVNQAKNLEVVSALRKHGIKIQVGFIMFNPYSRVEDLKLNASFLKEIGELFRMFPLTRAMDLFPGTSMVKKLATDALLSKHYSYKSNLVSDYKFQDKNVEIVYRAINKQYDEDSRKYDAEINNAFYRCSHKNHAKIRDELNEVHYSYFLNLMDSVHSEQSISRVNIERLQRLSVILEKLKGDTTC